MAYFRVYLAHFGRIAARRSVHFEVKIGVRKVTSRAFFATREFCHDEKSEQRSTRQDDVNFAEEFDDERQFASQFGATSGDDTQSATRCLYDEHIPTTPVQKGFLAVGSAFMSLYDPYRDDMIAALGEVTGHYALSRLQEKMLADPEGKQILKERPRITSQTVDMDWLAQLPQGTLGREYIDFMKRNKISCDTRAPVHFVDDEDLAYVMQRYREIHDFNHALLGMPATMLGEVTVKWFEMFNTGLPMTALGALFGPLRVKQRHIGKLMNVYIPWVVQTAPRAKLLLNVYFEQRWEQPLIELQDEIGIRPFTKER